MQMEQIQNYKVASLMSKSPEVYASIALPAVWISRCFTLSLSRKLQKHIYRGEWKTL